jgi:hypothetical protein
MPTATFKALAIGALATAIFPGIGSAQVEMPAPNSVTIGGDVGPLYIEGDPVKEDYFGTASVAAHIEYYYNPRVSLRGSFGYANPEYQSDAARTLQQKRILFNVLYYPFTGRSRAFERFRPFATIGGGAYFLETRLADLTVHNSGGKAGGNFGGGAEYWWRTFAVRTEFLVHAVGKADDGTSVNGATWMFGFKVPIFRGNR